jgi:hypothetical protein
VVLGYFKLFRYRPDDRDTESVVESNNLKVGRNLSKFRASRTLSPELEAGRSYLLMLTVLSAVNGDEQPPRCIKQPGLFNVFANMVLICPTQLGYDNPDDHHRDDPNDVPAPYLGVLST